MKWIKVFILSAFGISFWINENAHNIHAFHQTILLNVAVVVGVVSHNFLLRYSHNENSNEAIR